MTQIPDQTDVVKALGRDSITDPFLGNTIEIAIVTRDHKRTMEGLCRLGIGPWQVHTFSPENTTNQTYRGKPSPFTMKVCFALGTMIWELIEPVSGSTIFAEFLGTLEPTCNIVAMGGERFAHLSKLRTADHDEKNRSSAKAYHAEKLGLGGKRHRTRHTVVGDTRVVQNASIAIASATA